MKGTSEFTTPANKTKLAKPGEVAAMKKAFLADPVSRSAYFEATARFKVARLVKSMQTHAGLTQKELATCAGVSPASIAKIERAAGSEVTSVGLLVSLAAASGVELVLDYAKSEAPAF